MGPHIDLPNELPAWRIDMVTNEWVEIKRLTSHCKTRWLNKSKYARTLTKKK